MEQKDIFGPPMEVPKDRAQHPHETDEQRRDRMEKYSRETLEEIVSQADPDRYQGLTDSGYFKDICTASELLEKMGDVSEETQGAIRDQLLPKFEWNELTAESQKFISDLGPKVLEKLQHESEHCSVASSELVKEMRELTKEFIDKNNRRGLVDEIRDISSDDSDGNMARYLMALSLLAEKK